MKKTLKLFLLIAIAVVAMVFAVSCGSSVKGISVSKLYPYQSTYVLGQELNLAGGGLVITDENGTYEMPLNYSEIKVSGYDKDKLGLQRLTLEYMGAKTFLTVTVVERMIINGYTADYIVGDEFDVNKGKVTVTKDDGSSEVLDFKSNKITVSGFDSATAKSGADIKVTYKDTTSKYDSSFKVNVHPIDTIDFKSPDKKTYDSHYVVQTEVNGTLMSAVLPSVTGGKFTIYGNNNKIKREFPITVDMVSGLDLSVVSASKTSATQTLKVAFLGEEYTYDITVNYSNVTRFIDNAAPFQEIDFSGEKPVISQELGELAISLTKILMDMSFVDRAIIGGGVSYPVARTAFIYAYDIWAEEMKKFDGAFLYSNLGMAITSESCENAMAATELLKNQDSPLFTLAPMLVQLIDDYTDDESGKGMVVYGPSGSDNTYDKYYVPSAEDMKTLSAAFNAITSVYNELKSIPKNWTALDLTMNSAKIEAAYEIMKTNEIAASYPRLYYKVSDWCETDIFDILFTYLYGQEKLDDVQALVALGMPSKFDDLYSYTCAAAEVANGLAIGTHEDASGFFVYYTLAKKLETELADGTVEKYLYDNLVLRSWGSLSTKDAVTVGAYLETLRTTEKYGFDALFGSGLEDDELGAVMESYALLLENMLDADYASSDNFTTDVMALFNSFVTLSSEDQYAFVCMFYLPYAEGNVSIFEMSEGKTGFLFTTVVNNIILDTLPEACKDAYARLIAVIEAYINEEDTATWRTDFTEKYFLAQNAILNLDDADEAAFLALLGDAYDFYAEYLGGIYQP